MRYNTEKQDELLEHERYVNFYMKKIFGEFDAGDRVSLLVNGQSVLDYTIQFDECHFSLSIQDKALLEKTELEKLQREKAELEKRIAELSR